MTAICPYLAALTDAERASIYARVSSILFLTRLVSVDSRDEPLPTGPKAGNISVPDGGGINLRLLICSPFLSLWCWDVPPPACLDGR